MDGLIKNNASKPLENRPIESSPIQLSEDRDFCMTENAATMNFLDPFNNDDNFFGVSDMLVVNPPQYPICANLLGNMERKSHSHDLVMKDNDDNTVTGAPLFSNFWIPERARNSFNCESNMAAGVQPQSLGRGTNLTSHVRDDAFNNQDAMSFSSLYSNIQEPQIDINTPNSRGNAEVQQHSLGGTATATVTDTASVHSFRASSADFMSIPSQFSTFQIPQIVRSKANIGANTVAGVQIQSQGETATGTPHVHGVNSNDEIRFPSMFNNYLCQTERSSTNIGRNRHLRTQRNSRGGAAIGTSHAQGARSNGGNSMSVATQPHNMQSIQINRSSISIGGKGAAAIKPSSRGKTGTSRSHVHGVTIDGSTNTSIPTQCSNLHGQQINRSPISVDGALASRMRANNRDKKIDGTNLGSNALLLNEVHSSMTDRNFLSVGGNIPEVEHSQVREKLRVGNNVKTNDNQSNGTNQLNSAICSEEMDNSFLNLGFRGNTTASLRSNAFGGGISSNNGCPVTTRSHTFSGSQTDGNFLSLGGDLGDQTWSNNANTIMSGTNAGVSSNSYTSLGGTIGNQTWSNNASRIISGTNAGIDSNPFTIPQTERGNVHQYILRPSGRTLGPGGGNGAGMYPNTIPYTGFHGHSGVALRQFSSIPASLHANEQARLSSLPLGPSSLVGNPNGPFSTPQQAYMNNVRRISTTSSMAYSPSSTVARTFQQDQSGHPIPVNNTIAEAAKGIAALYDNSKQAQTNQGTAHICRRGKRVPADGIQYAQSAKVLLGPSVTGKPVPVAGCFGLARTSEGLLRQNQSNNIPSTSTTLRAPRGRKTLQHTGNPSAALAGSQTNVVYHLRWKDPTDSYQSSGENCHLCKRDLTYTPTGPVTQPSVPPAVAVLPCGHTFHDECLERITPEDQLKNPPCIPCAIGTL